MLESVLTGRNTVGENYIGAAKMYIKHFLKLFESVNLQYCDSNIGIFIIDPNLVIAMAQVVFSVYIYHKRWKSNYYRNSKEE